MSISRRRLLGTAGATAVAATLGGAAPNHAGLASAPEPDGARGREPEPTGVRVPTVPQPRGRPIIFYSPHQDDETLFMGHVIAHHTLIGRGVHVSLLTRGAGSVAIDAINGVRPSTWWGGRHQPAQEGYRPLTLDEFVVARNREYVAACGALGIWPDNIHLDPCEDLTVDAAKRVMRSYADRYPNAGHYTMWWRDGHVEHAQIGQALLELHESDDRFRDSRWLVKPVEADEAEALPYRVRDEDLRARAAKMVWRALLPYTSWAPATGMFAIGGHSIGNTYLADVMAGAPNHILKY
jgi:LmbE family N-acetylglucosaminyl deacetylase